MRNTFATFIIILIGLSAFGQENPRTVESYENKVKSRTVLTRWFWTIQGFSPYLRKESLQLKSDNSFTYSYQGGDCGIFDISGSGTWTKNGNELILQPNADCYMLKNRYLIDGRRLYTNRDTLESLTLAFKRKL